jgi:hypothetical protein
VLAALVECPAAIGCSTQDEFDPRRFLEEFSPKVERLIPHDRLVIACLNGDHRVLRVLRGRGWPARCR